MFSYQIDEILKRNTTTKKAYIGCFPADQIPKISIKFPHCFCVNTSPSGERGEHWTAIFIPSKNTAEYFDSLGEFPAENQEIGKYLSNFSTIKYNSIKIQSEKSSVCGKHVIYFLHMRCKEIPFEQILKRLCGGHTKPDILVRNFVEHLIEKGAVKNI